jgi:hypothetical protein
MPGLTLVQSIALAGACGVTLVAGGAVLLARLCALGRAAAARTAD